MRWFEAAASDLHEVMGYPRAQVLIADCTRWPSARFAFIESSAQDRKPRESSTDSFHTAYPSWLVPAATSQISTSSVQPADGDGRRSMEELEAIQCFHAGTSLPGRISCLVDPGARISMNTS